MPRSCLPLALAAALCVAGLAACDGDNAVGPLLDTMPDAQVITGRPDLGPAPAPAPNAALTASIDAFAGDVGFFAMDLDTAEAMAHDGTLRFPAGGLSALFVVATYAAQVEAGALVADRSVQLRPADIRGTGLGPGDAGQVYTLSELAARALDGDRTAEQLLVRTLGGSEAVDGVLADFDIDGIGAYLDPCARDRLYAEALDPRFEGVECPDIGLWLYAGVTSGLVPRPFRTPPDFDDATRAAAADVRTSSTAGTITARAMARILALLDAGDLVSPAADARIRSLLDGSRAGGGGDDGLPASVWSGSVEGATEDGRHWAGRIRGAGGESFVLVVLNAGGTEVDTLTRALGSGAWSALMGEVPWPPMTPAEPGEAVVELTEVARADACNSAEGGLDGQRMCRSEAATMAFSAGDEVTATLIAPGPGPFESAWIWAAPDGQRVRTQERLARSAWWVWSETRRIFETGQWAVTVSVDGRVVRHALFTVDD